MTIHTGITQVQVIQQLQDQKKRTEDLYLNVAVGSAITVGVVVVISTVAWGIFTLVSLPRLDKVIGELGKEKTIKVIDPDFSGLAVLAILSLSFGWALTGIIAFGVTFGLVLLAKVYKVHQLAKKELFVKEKYEDNGLIEKGDIEQLLKSLDRTGRTALVAEMNFDQLSIARKTLGDWQFEKCIKSVNQEQHKQWLFLISLGSKTDEVKTKLSHDNVKTIAKINPFFVQALQEQFKNSIDFELKDLISQYCTPELSPSKRSPPLDAVIYLSADKHTPIKVSKSQISENSGYFRTLLTGSYKETKETVIDLSDIGDPDDFQLFVNLLNGETIEMTTDIAVRLIPLADRFSCTKLHASLDAYMMSHSDEIEEDSLLTLASNYHVKKTANYLEQQYLSLKLTPDNWEKMWEISQKGHFNQLSKKCRAYALSQIKKMLITDGLHTTKSHTQVQDYFNILESAEKDQLYNVLLGGLSITNFRAIYQFEILNPKSDLKALCLAYTNLNKQNFKDQMPWEYDEIPLDVFSQVYPTTKRDATAW